MSNDQLQHEELESQYWLLCRIPRMLIALRDRYEPGFLGGPDQYAPWNLERLMLSEHWPARLLLSELRTALRKVRVMPFSPCAVLVLRTLQLFICPQHQSAVICSTQYTACDGLDWETTASWQFLELLQRRLRALKHRIASGELSAGRPATSQPQLPELEQNL